MSSCRRTAPIQAFAAAALLALGLASTAASAALVSYRFTGHFSGGATAGSDAALASAIAPQLGTQAVSIDVSLDTAVASAPLAGGGSLYRAITASSYSFAGFSAVNAPCAGSSDLICTVQVKDGTGVVGGTGADSFALFPAIARSIDFETAVASSRRLDLQMNLFLLDFLGQALSSASLSQDLAALPLALWDGNFSVFAAAATGGFDRADFAFEVTSVVNLTVGTGQLPEPGSAALLAAAGLAGLALRRRRA